MPLTGKQRLFAGAGLVLACLLVYVPALRAGFAWNDDTFFWDNPHIHSPTGLFTFWFTTETPDYFPLTSTILWLEWRIFGLEQTWGYHTVNVLLHAVSCVLLWRLLERLAISGAWVAALLFAIHPVNVEAVAWITQLKTTLPMVLTLGSALLFFQVQKPGSGALSRPFLRAPQYWLALLCFALALLAKTSVVALPVVLLVLTWWRSGAITRHDLARALPFFAIAGALALVTIWFQSNRAIVDEVVREDGFLSRLAIAGRALWFYLTKAFLPFNLSFVYPRWQAQPANPAAYFPLAAFLIVLGALWHLRSHPQARGALAGLVIYAAMLFPVLGFFNIYFMRYSLVADHWQYHAIPAVIAMTVSFAAAQRWLTAPARRGLAIPVVALLGALTWLQAADYHDEETLLRATLEKNPTAWMAHHNLALLLADRGNVDDALIHLRRTVALQPNHARAYSSLASVLRQKGQTDEAIVHYWKAIELEPGFVEGVFNLGNALLEVGRFEEAITAYRQTVQMAPEVALAYNNLGVAYRETGDRFEARAHFEAALDRNPANLNALTNLASLLASAPEASLRDGAKAVALSTEASRLTGANEAWVQQILAAAQAEAGDFPGAARTAQRALDLASARGNAALTESLRRQLGLYTAGRPFHETSKTKSGNSPAPP